MKPPVKPIAKIRKSQSYSYNKSYVDYDYLNKLSPEELEYLASFNDEYYGSSTDARRRDTINKQRITVDVDLDCNSLFGVTSPSQLDEAINNQEIQAQAERVALLKQQRIERRRNRQRLYSQAKRDLKVIKGDK